MRKTIKFLKCQDGYWGSKKLPGTIITLLGKTKGHGICNDRLSEIFAIPSDAKTIWVEVRSKQTKGASIIAGASMAVSVNGKEEGVFPAVHDYLAPLFAKHRVLFMKIMY